MDTLQFDEEFDEDMYDDTNDNTYGEDFVVNCNIVSVLPAEYDMVSEVSEAEEDFMPDKTNIFPNWIIWFSLFLLTLFLEPLILKERIFIDPFYLSPP